jgi:hypothetical protein
MFRTLARIAGVSGVVAVACMALAFAIGGPEMRNNGFGFNHRSWQSSDDHGKPGTGKLRDHANFTSVDVSGGVEASLVVGPAFKVEIIGDYPEQIETRVEGSQLRIRRHSRFSWWGGPEMPKVHVEMPALGAVRSAAGADVTAAGINSDNLNLTVSSGSRLGASGKCRMLAVKASSGADLDAGDLACETGQVDASSGASLKVRVSSKLDVDASSGADVRNLGGSKSGEVSLTSGASLHNP